MQSIEIFLQSSVNGLPESEDVLHDAVGVFHLAAHRGFALLNVSLPVNGVARNPGQPARPAVDAEFDCGKAGIMFQRIRTVSSNVSPYANDYQDLGALKQLADKHHIAVLLIHHLRKMNDDDPMNMISGTTGISGAADSSFVLRKDKRSGSTATLYCTGRDICLRSSTSCMRTWLLSGSVRNGIRLWPRVMNGSRRF